MDVLQKVELFNQVLAGQRPMSDLKDHLEGENWIGSAVNEIVNRHLRNPKRGEFRLKLVTPTFESGKKKEQVTFTEWQPEYGQMTAPTFMGQIRQQNPKAKISVERR